jgi:hypothetical protein
MKIFLLHRYAQPAQGMGPPESSTRAMINGAWDCDPASTTVPLILPVAGAVCIINIAAKRKLMTAFDG